MSAVLHERIVDISLVTAVEYSLFLENSRRNRDGSGVERENQATNYSDDTITSNAIEGIDTLKRECTSYSYSKKNGRLIPLLIKARYFLGELEPNFFPKQS